ncbi:MAG: leucyl/phenylalanyl-tRNA--protein transferase [bacterium]|nr:leucyl/phenylalanyl-tRNA--protein transferase [Gammaproteobacteria bacterium]HIL96817.1 leucyl/phenylalanyl-tRNA--protein transferase [Pseudomonadales bacterium]
MKTVSWLDSTSDDFPPIDQALTDPNGLLAAGGDLSPERLLRAYRSGIFPWYEEDQPLLWWSPDPRAVLYPEKVKVSRSLAKRIKRQEFEVRLNSDFIGVISACAEARAYSSETWITGAMINAYTLLHQQGSAHSVECYKDNCLVGGLYGVSIGRLFFGESMFHTETDASKIAFVYLCRLMQAQRCPLIDCQIENPHLVSLGSENISREKFRSYLEHYCEEANPINWLNLPSKLSD